MKKIYLVFLFFSFMWGTAQCTITGADQVQVGEKQTYSVEENTGACADCYDWTHLDQNLILEGDTHANPLTLKGAVIGAGILSLEIKTADGILKCQKSIQVVQPTNIAIDTNAEKCSIQIEAFKELRVSNTSVIFDPIGAENNASYQWTVTYRNGSKKTSNMKQGQFEYSNDSVIDAVELQIITNKCTKKISKTYHTNFWYFF